MGYDHARRINTDLTDTEILTHPTPANEFVAGKFDPESFSAAARRFDFVPVHRRILADTLTPVTAFVRLDDGGPGGLFESVIGGEKVGRYSIVATRPVARFAAAAGVVTIHRDGDAIRQRCDDPMNVFRQSFDYSVAPSPGLPPFIGGAIGYAAYDIVRYAERLEHAPPNDRDLPDLDFGFYHTVCVFDHVAKTIFVIHLADCREIDDATLPEQIETLGRDASNEVDEVLSQLRDPASDRLVGLDLDLDESESNSESLPVHSNFTREAFCGVVDRCVEYIRAGDIFQVVPSQRMAVDAPGIEPLEVYRSLRVVNPSPFMFLLRTEQCTLVGCSPEIMCRVQDRVVTVRPLAGTRRRGRNEAEDLALERELLDDPKERAEHVMLVDLGRNDVGRVARYGSVELTEVMVIERYSHVMHISSEVRGTLRDDLDAFDALAAALPAGTVSGAPKVRAMEIIDEMEPHRRGPYGGAVGYIDYRGNMDTCIALRTLVHQNDRYYVQAGCGVVADSIPDNEYQETINKAQAMIAAIDLTRRRIAAGGLAR